MKNRDGNFLEIVSKLIMNSFNDSDSSVETNFHISNKAKRRREFDIVISTKSHGIPFTIGIECKNYKNISL